MTRNNMSMEYANQKPMSDFSLPRLKEIPTANRRAVMSEEWEKVATEEMMDAVENAENKWMRCLPLLRGKIKNESEMRRQAKEWTELISTIILSFHRDIIAIAQVKNHDVKQLQKSAWHCVKALKEWSQAIESAADTDELQGLVRLGIDVLKSHQMSPEEALYELRLAAAREVKERTGI